MTTTRTASPLVETGWLANHTDDTDLRVIEIDFNRSAYDSGHIPGALFWNVYTDLLQPNYRIIQRDAFAALLARSGITRDMTVVVHGYAASLGFWMLRHYGFGRTSLLNGSRRKWLDEQLPVSTEAPHIDATTLSVTDFGPVQDGIRASHAEVEQAIGNPAVRLMDVRSLLEYSGERFWPSLPPEGDQRGGHLPGATHVPIEETVQEDGTFKSASDLSMLYASRGFAPDTDVITYCAVGGRASQAWFVLTYLLGYPRVRVYDASWIEWGQLPGVPVEK